MPRQRHLTTAAIATALAFAFAAPAGAATRITDPDYPRSLEAEGPVAVSWDDPAGFTEIRYSRDRFAAGRGNWVHDIAAYVATRAGKALGPGERLEVHITDIDRAGDYEYGARRADFVRVVRDVYPPRISLRYTLYDAGGQVADSGERRLTDPGFLSSGIGLPSSSDPLRHEKRLVDDWVRRDLQARGNVAARDD